MNRMARNEQTLVPPAGTLRPMRAAAIFLALGLLAVIIPQVGDIYSHALLATMVVCCIAPAWQEWQTGRLDVFETVHVIGLLYLLYFGFGAIWAINDPVNIAFDIYLVSFLPLAMLYSLLGYLALLAGYFGPWYQGPVRRTWIEVPRGALFLLVPGLVGLLGSVAEAAWSHARWLGASFPMIISSLAQFAPLFMFAWALCWLLLFSGRATPAQKRVTWFVLVPGALLVVLTSLTDKSLAMTLAGVPLIGLWYARRKIPWKTLLVLLLLLIFVVFPFYNTFRVLDPRIPWKARVILTTESIRDWSFDEYWEQSAVMAQRRMALANCVAVVIRDVPRWIPYANGETLFLPAVGFLIPRVLWPDKPSFTMGRRFAETFRVVHILDSETRVSVTVPGELYWNFDLPGIILGMALWGVALRFFYRRYGESLATDPVRHAIHIVLLIQFVHFGGGLAAQAVSVVRTLLLLELLRWFGRRTGMLEVRRVAQQK
jgi:hypothetical protein